MNSKFCSECGLELAAANNSHPPAAQPANGISSAMGERRYLTVMFCDLVGSTALSARMELEDLQEVIGAFQKLVAEIVAQFGGFVARRAGDGALVYFGYPRGGEDDPEQAVRAGLALVEAIGELRAPEPLQMRIGIATGLVVVGYLSGGTETTHDLDVWGEGPNLAARLQALAEPNTIVIGDSTRRLIGSVFELEDLGVQQLKGFAKPQPCWRAVSEGGFERQFDALRPSVTPFIGREQEIELMLSRWAQAKDGKGHVVLLCGEPGVGKSRLSAELRERLHAERHINLRLFCSSHHQDSTLFPIIVELERTAEFRREDTPQAKLDKLERLLAAASPSSLDLALVAELLLLPTDRYHPPDLTPRSRKEKTFEALLQQLIAAALRQPVLLTIEDLHWSDPTTRELLDATIERIEGLPVLLVATFRPEYQPSRVGTSHVTMLALSGFSRRESEALVRGVAADRGWLLDELVEEIVERTDGVPLFLEEVTKAVLEIGASPDRARELLSATPGPPQAVPATLHASLMARLDRLGTAAKEVVQIAATIGRGFSYELLAIVARQSESELKERIGRLVRAGFILQRGELPRSMFLFKHALVQEVAYSTLLRGPRQKLHARIALALEEVFSDTIDSQPELLAFHLSKAGLPERATPHWLHAGALALRRSAVREAVTHLSTALHSLEGQPPSPIRTRHELEIRLGLGTALNIARGSSDPDVARQYDRAVDLGRELGDDKQLFRAVWGKWYASLTTGQTERALSHAKELVEVAERLTDQNLMLEAYHSRWATSHVLGINSVTLTDTERGIALYEPNRHHAHAYDYGGHDTGVCARAHRCVTLWITGYPEQALGMSIEALELGRRLGHPPSHAHAAWWSATLRQLLREPETCRELAELTIRIGREQGSDIFMMCPLLLGWVSFESGKIADGLQMMEQAIVAKRERVWRFYFDYELLVLAESLLKAGKIARALEIVEEAVSFVESSRNRLFEAEAFRLKGACLAASGEDRAKEAETWLLKAVETAEHQGALSLKLRAATSLTRCRPYWCELLAAVFRQFTEGLNTPDLRDAKALIDAFEGHR